ncbi:nucleoprotein [Lepeophtheirus salmonis rhabdovirus 127]|uniref:Nucleoprotein n=1 Tax=Lepeophtheirus salmonis rhabdovirus 127 TaxID=1573761 RepID=A0A0A1E6D1_9RHAB|nr:nucleoprotein [Lepeophtheirus salmonis rhabdovirus 127]AIY25912.1 nucleoprotein [Lepeophtheirus salmonis rhabdovirus 127]
MALTKLVLVSDPTKSITIGKSILVTPASFPSQWFADNPGEKPRVIIDVPKTLQDEDVSSVFFQYITTRTPVPVWAICKSIKYLLDQDFITLPAKEEWKSFGRLLGRGGTQVFLNDLSDITWNPVEIITPPGEKNRRTDGELYLALILVLISVRIDREPIRAGQVRLMERFSSLPSPSGTTAAGILRDSHVSVTDELRFFLAITDMYLFRKGPTARYSLLRQGTIITRHRDQTFLSEFDHISNITAMEPSEVMTWVTLDSVSTEILKTVRDTEEIYCPFSYAPYMMDLGISAKSPYSVTENPLSHLWIHVTGVILNNPRSMNARIIGETTFHQVILSSALLAYRCATSPLLSQKFSGQSDLRGVEESIRVLSESSSYFSNTEDLDLEDDPQQNTPMAYVAWCDNKWNRRLFTFVDSAMLGLTRPLRERQMGHIFRDFWAGFRNQIAEDLNVPLKNWTRTAIEGAGRI